MMTSFSIAPERVGVASNHLPGAGPGKILSTFLPALPDQLVSAGCISSSPRRCPASGSSPPRPRLRQSFPPPLPTLPFSSAAARILCGCSADDPARNRAAALQNPVRSEEHTSELQSPDHLVCRLLLEKKKQMHKHSQLAPEVLHIGRPNDQCSLALVAIGEDALLMLTELRDDHVHAVVAH